MNPKDLLFSTEAREKIMAGVTMVRRAVGTTLGPKGRNVALHTKYAGVITVHDGVTVAREIFLKDKFENVGAILIRQASQRTNDVSGDGTTTATVLAEAIAIEGNKLITAGANPMLMKKGIDAAVKQTVELLKKQAKQIKGIEELKQVATISAADEEIGTVVAEALEKVGKHGVVTTAVGQELGFNVEYKDGMEWDKGWHLPFFVTDIKRMEATIKDPFILITDRTISSPKEIIPLLTIMNNANEKNLVIISDGVEREALALLGLNFQKGVVNVLAVPAPSFGDHKRDGLQDIAILTGGTFISQELGKTLETITLEDLGRADQISATRESTVIAGGKGDKEKIKERAESIEKQIEDSKHDLEKERYQERLAKLTAGVAVIKVGASSDQEAKEKEERVKDAIGATKAARDDGIVSGGGVALLNLIDQISTDYPTQEEVMGAELLKKALSYPAKLLAENAGKDGEVIVNEISRKEKGFGYDVVKDEYVNMIAAGIIDPVKVTISALQNGASCATMILTTEAVIVDAEEEKPKQNE